MAVKTRKAKVTTIDAETWAASGGTAGMFGKLWKQGRLKIVSEHIEPDNQQRPHRER